VIAGEIGFKSVFLIYDFATVPIYHVSMTIMRVKPLKILMENGLTSAEEEKILKEIAWAKKHGKRYSLAKEMHDDFERSIEINLAGMNSGERGLKARVINRAF
jgi:hypothetical protein